MKKRILSLLIIMAMMLSICPVAIADAPAKMVIQPAADYSMNNTSGRPAWSNYGWLQVVAKSTTPPSHASHGIGLIGYDVSDVYETLSENPGYVVKSVKFKPYVGYFKSGATDLAMNMYVLNSDWRSAVLSNKNDKSFLPGYVADSGDTFNYPQFGTPDLIIETDIATASNYSQKKENSIYYRSADLKEYDITSLFRIHTSENSGNENQNFFSFAFDLTTKTGGTTEFHIPTLENVNGEGGCYYYTSAGYSSLSELASAATIEVEYEYLAEMTPSNEAVLPELPSDDFEITFNNAISTATVKVNGVIADATINDAKLVVDYDFKQFTDYTIEIEVSDDYNSTYTNSYNFYVGRDLTTTTIEMNKNNGNFHDAAYLEDEKATEYSLNASRNVYYKYYENNNDSFVMYRIALPDVPQGSYLDKAVFNYTAYGSAPIDYWRVFKFPGESWYIDKDTYKTNGTTYDETVKAIIDDYDTYNAGDVFASTPYPGNADQNIYSVDITEYANECIAAGQDYIYLGVTAYRTTVKVRVHYSATTQYIDYTIANQPAVEFANASSTVNGSTLSKLAFDVYTSFNKATLLDAISIIDEDGNAVEGANFNYTSGKVTLAGAVDLDEEKTYKVVIAEGTADKFGNTVSAEKSVVCEFETEKNYIVSEFRLSGEDNKPMTAFGNVKASATITNNTSKAMDIYVVVASYDGDKLAELSICPYTVQASGSLNVETEIIDSTGAEIVKGLIWTQENIRPLANAQVYPVQ